MSTLNPAHPTQAPHLDVTSSEGAPPQVTKPSADTARWTLSINSSKLLTALVLAMLVVLSLHLWVVVTFLQGLDFKGSQRLYFDDEGNLPAYFSTFIIFLSAILLTCIAYFKRAEGDRFAKHWTVLALLFFRLDGRRSAELS